MPNPSQSDVNPKPIHHNLGPIQYQSCVKQPPIRPSPIPILCQSDVNPMSIQCQPLSNLPTITQSTVNRRILLKYQSYVNLMSIHVNVNTLPKFQSNVNPSPINQSQGNLPITCKSANCMSTLCKFANPMPILQKPSIHWPRKINKNTNQLSITFQFANPLPISQSHTYWSIQCQIR